MPIPASNIRPDKPFIPGKRTKNGEDIELELPRQSMGLVDLYIAKYRNELIDPRHRGNIPRFLFPKSDGTAKSGRILADAICRVLMREIGTKFNFHLFRHLGCFLYLRSHPGQIDVIRRVLGQIKETKGIRLAESRENRDCKWTGHQADLAFVHLARA